MIDIERAIEIMRDDSLVWEDPNLTFSTRKDLNAMLLLDRLCPGKRDIVSCVEHDQIWFSVCLSEIVDQADEEDIKNLRRCGVVLEEDDLTMYV